MSEEIARGMVCFFHQKKHSYLIYFLELWISDILNSKYEDVPTVKISSDPLYPCVEHDALVPIR
jgi:hypothetical protein